MAFVRSKNNRERRERALLKKIRYKTKRFDLDVHDMQKWDWSEKDRCFISPGGDFWMKHVKNKHGGLEIKIGEMSRFV